MAAPSQYLNRRRNQDSDLYLPSFFDYTDAIMEQEVLNQILGVFDQILASIGHDESERQRLATQLTTQLFTLAFIHLTAEQLGDTPPAELPSTREGLLDKLAGKFTESELAAAIEAAAQELLGAFFREVLPTLAPHHQKDLAKLMIKLEEEAKYG